MNEGILITPEILEKNGFERNEEDTPLFTVVAYSIDSDDMVLLQRPKGGWKLICGTQAETQAEVLFGDSKFICMPITYVDELVLVLKLFGIDKEIKNPE